MSKYKVGDKVRIKSKLDPGKSCNDYPFGFLTHMIETYGGQTLIVKRIEANGSELATKLGDPYAYYLEGEGFTWHSSMFEGSTSLTSNRKHHAKINLHI